MSSFFWPPNAGSSGTVTTISVASANGFAGTVSNPTTTPALTISTTVTGILKGNGTAISAATAGTDYVIPSGSITGTAGNITATSNSTLTTLTALSLPYSQLSGTVPTWNQNTTGTAANITATSNSSLTTLSALSLPYSQVTGGPSTNAITALTGDGTATGPGSVALTLATVNTNTGSFGSSTAIPSFTVNGKGLITAASTNVVIAPAGTLSGTTLNSTVVSSSLTSVGTIATGVWNGTIITAAFGGTGVSTASANTVHAGPVSGSAAAPTFRALVTADTPAVLRVKYTSANNTINASNTTIVNATLEYDNTSSAYNSGTGIFTCPIAGLYRISGGYNVSSTTTASISNSVNLMAQHNATTQVINRFFFQTTSAEGLAGYGGTIFSCAASDTLSLVAIRGSGVTSFACDGSNSTWIAIEFVSN